MPSAGISSLPRYCSYLTTQRGILYFRILVPNHLQSLIGKREIRRSLNGLDSRTARTKALRLSLAAQHFFALADDLAHERIHCAQEKTVQSFGITKENIKSVGTFLFDSILEKDLSPASLTLLLPSFLREQEGIASSTKIFSEKIEATEAGRACEERFSFPKEETPSVEPTETVRRRIKLEEKGRLPNLREAFDAYVKAKTLTWSAASAKDIPPQVRQFVEIVRELEHGRDIRVDELSREHIRSYFDTLKHLPCRLCGQRLAPACRYGPLRADRTAFKREDDGSPTDKRAKFRQLVRVGVSRSCTGQIRELRVPEGSLRQGHQTKRSEARGVHTR